MRHRGEARWRSVLVIAASCTADRKCDATILCRCTLSHGPFMNTYGFDLSNLLPELFADTPLLKSKRIDLLIAFY